ncbi:hypothetical protein [Roseibium sp. RKSG952]|uniref:hypothetical protein n=1 Tax=Roseibium sp. RKSG952 TaxID=2529384 RepID=UPI0012BC07E1|nr:hypothetical protein [Roseibium sp. RKSG952]MTI00034.1 hypothetical protein [Roseibium sp. RKSG952]
MLLTDRDSIFKYTFLFLAALVFCYIVKLAVNDSRYVLLSLVLFLPTLVPIAFGMGRKSGRLIQLIAIQGTFLLVLGTYIAFPDVMARIIDVDLAIKVALFAYIFAQACGFALFSYKNKRYLNIFNSLMAMAIFFGYIYQSAPDHLQFEPHEPIKPLGHNEPPIIIAAYCFWFVSVIANSSRCPKLVEIYVHSASVIFAIFSGSFLFYRILTAWSLFVLDMIFNYTGVKFWGERALRMSNRFATNRWPKLRAGCECFSFVSLATLVGYVITGRAKLSEDLILTAELAAGLR